MGWRDRAEKVEDEQPATWRARAEADLPFGRKSVVMPAPLQSDAVETPEPFEHSKVGAAALGFGQGASAGFLDEIDAGGRALVESAHARLFGPEPELTPAGETVDAAPEPASLADVYRKLLGETRASYKQAQREQPTAYLGGQVAGDMATQTILAAGTGGASLTPAAQAGIGAIHGLGNSEADLTQGQFKGALADTSIGAGAGYVGGKVAQGIGAGLGRVGDFAVRKVREATADAGERAAMNALRNVRQAISSLGGETSSAKRTLEVLQEILSSPTATAEQRAAAQALLNGAEGQALLRGVFDGTLARAPGQLGRVNAAGELLEQAQRNATPEALETAANELLSKPLEPWARFAKNYASRAIPPAIGAWVGRQIDDDGAAGTIAGAGVGALAGAALGNPGLALRNALNNPAWRKLAWSAVESAIQAGGKGLGAYGPVLARQFALSPGSAQQMHEALLSEDENYQRLFVQPEDAQP